MYCSNCGRQAEEGARFCRHCGASIKDSGICPNCGMEPDEGARFCNHCGVSLRNSAAGEPASGGPRPAKSKVAAGVTAIVLGGLGVHKFYLGYTGPGVILLAATFVSLLLMIVLIGFLGLIAIGIITLIEGIMYLTKTDEEFHHTYVENRKDWF